MRRPHPRAALAAAGGVVVVVLCLAAGGALGGFQAAIGNGTDTTAAASVVISANGCTAVPSAATTPCATGTTAVAPGVPATGTASTSTAVTQSGSLSATTTVVQPASCGAVQYADAGRTPLLERYAVGNATSSGPYTDTGAITTTSAAGYASSVLNETVGTSYSVAIWFRFTSAKATGTLLSFESAPSVVTGSSVDRTLTFDGSGRLVVTSGTKSLAGLGGPSTATFATAPTANTWHRAVVTVTQVSIAVGLSQAFSISLDGSAPVSTPGNLLSPSSTFAGYWLVGSSSTAGQFAGSIADVVIAGGTFTTADQTSLNTATTQAQFVTAVSGLSTGVTHFWPLSGTSATAYTGTVPSASGTAPCSQAQASVTVAGGSVAAYSSLAAWVSATVGAVSGTTPVAVTLSRASAYSVPVGQGLHLSFPLVVSERAGGFSSALLFTPNETVLS